MGFTIAEEQIFGIQKLSKLSPCCSFKTLNNSSLISCHSYLHFKSEFGGFSIFGPNQNKNTESNIFWTKTTPSEQPLTSLSWKTNICIFYKNNNILEILFPRKPVDPVTNMFFSLRKPKTFNSI